MEQNTNEVVKQPNALKVILDVVFIHELPSYGNKIYYGMGFLALLSLVMALISGIVLAFNGMTWWLQEPIGSYVRSVHTWSVQSLVAVLLLHITVVLLTSGFKASKKIVWMFGSTIFCLALIQTEFGYGLRGDFESQWRAISGADFWNGAYLGHWLNPNNFNQVFALHILIIPALMVVLFFFHFLLEKSYGISKPYRSDVEYEMVPANHKIMFARGGVLIAIILVLSAVFPSPFDAPYSAARVAQEDSNLLGQTILQEFDHTSDTATYLVSINPYTFDTREAYVDIPYKQYIAATGGVDMLNIYFSLPPDTQQTVLDEAKSYFNDNSTVSAVSVSSNPIILTVNALVEMARSGLYDAAINQEDQNSNPTRLLRFLSDTGVMDIEAARIHMSTEEWGMAREMSVPGLHALGSWWFAPIGALNSTVLHEDENGDRDAAAILGVFMILFILFPFIPVLNRIPEKLNLARFIWRKEKSKDGETK
ncbi:MAG: cytochrome b N-terminal domain-containing protein [Candidatus Paceibacterota bacterium]